MNVGQQPGANAQPIPEPPPPPPGFELDPALEPQVTIRKRGEDTVEEYRIAGKLYMISFEAPRRRDFAAGIEDFRKLADSARLP